MDLEDLEVDLDQEGPTTPPLHSKKKSGKSVVFDQTGERGVSEGTSKAKPQVY